MTTKEAPVRGLHAKLAEVMAEAERIPKNGKAPAAMGGFPFVQVGDAADFIRKALGSRGVSMLPTLVEILGQSEHATKSGGTMTTVELRVTWTLTCADTGESATLQSYGVGADSGDKYSGKATTTAMKYALLSGFLLSTGDDVEQTDTSDRAPRETVGGETLEVLGNLSKTGTIVAGGSDSYKLEWRDAPDGGRSIGFRLKLPEDKDIPQVLITGPIGAALELAYPDGTKLSRLHVTVRGKLYGVRQPGRSTYYRLIVGPADADFIETPDVRIPALPEVAAEPVEAASEPLPFDMDEVDRSAGVA